MFILQHVDVDKPCRCQGQVENGEFTSMRLIQITKICLEDAPNSLAFVKLGFNQNIIIRKKIMKKIYIISFIY